MSTLDGPIWSNRSIALTCPARSRFHAHRAGKDGARVGMNVTAHQQKVENEETKKGRRKEKKKRKEATDFEEAVCCPSAIVQEAA